MSIFGKWHAPNENSAVSPNNALLSPQRLDASFPSEIQKYGNIQKSQLDHRKSVGQHQREVVWSIQKLEAFCCANLVTEVIQNAVLGCGQKYECCGSPNPLNAVRSPQLAVIDSVAFLFWKG